MDLIKTSSAARAPDAGLTLLEMLAALVITATVTTFIAMSLAGTRTASTLDDAAAMLANDLRLARTAAHTRGEDVEVTLTSSGYVIEALAVERRWDRDMTVRWRMPTQRGTITSFTFSATRLNQAELEVALTREGDRRTLQVDAITGRVHGTR